MLCRFVRQVSLRAVLRKLDYLSPTQPEIRDATHIHRTLTLTSTLTPLLRIHHSPQDSLCASDDTHLLSTPQTTNCADCQSILEGSISPRLHDSRVFRLTVLSPTRPCIYKRVTSSLSTTHSQMLPVISFQGVFTQFSYEKQTVINATAAKFTLDAYLPCEDARGHTDVEIHVYYCKKGKQVVIDAPFLLGKSYNSLTGTWKVERRVGEHRWCIDATQEAAATPQLQTNITTTGKRKLVSSSIVPTRLRATFIVAAAPSCAFHLPRQRTLRQDSTADCSYSIANSWSGPSCSPSSRLQVVHPARHCLSVPQRRRGRCSLG